MLNYVAKLFAISLRATNLTVDQHMARHDPIDIGSFVRSPLATLALCYFVCIMVLILEKQSTRFSVPTKIPGKIEFIVKLSLLNRR